MLQTIYQCRKAVEVANIAYGGFNRQAFGAQKEPSIIQRFCGSTNEKDFASALGEPPGAGKAKPLAGTRDKGKASIKPKAILWAICLRIHE